MGLLVICILAQGIGAFLIVRKFYQGMIKIKISVDHWTDSYSQRSINKSLDTIKHNNYFIFCYNSPNFTNNSHSLRSNLCLL
jgi:hypothetical protein